MNKTLLALTVTAASVSTATTAATVYKDDTTTFNVGGRVEVRANFSEANKTDSDANQFEDASRVRLNLGGEHKINNDVSFLGFAEWEITENDDPMGDDGLINTRYLYAGVNSKTYGALTYGHQDNAFTYLTNFTDRAEVFSGYINEFNVATSDRASNVLRYAYATDKFTFQVSGQIESDSDGTAIETPNGFSGPVTQNADGYGIIAAYKITDSIELGAGFAQTSGNAAGIDRVSNGDNYTYSLAAKYSKDGLDLATTWQSGSLSLAKGTDEDFWGIDAYAGYTFGDNNVNMTYNYLDAEGHDLNAANMDNIGIEYARYFGNATIYGAYQFNLLALGDAETKAQTEDQLQIGLRYAF